VIAGLQQRFIFRELFFQIGEILVFFEFLSCLIPQKIQVNFKTLIDIRIFIRQQKLQNNNNILNPNNLFCQTWLNHLLSKFLDRKNAILIRLIDEVRA